MAHKALHISNMVSIEANEIGFRRAKFNKPYRFVRVTHGFSFDVIPSLLENDRHNGRSWILWLDYDKKLDLDELDELKFIAANAPDDSVLLVTFDATDHRYGSGWQARYESLRDLFPSLVDDRIGRHDLQDIEFAATLTTLVGDVLLSTANKVARAGGCVPAFKIVYRDKATMATVGAILPSERSQKVIRECVASPHWPGFAAEPVVAPHLTGKEVSVLQARLPSARPMTRTGVRTLGFDLEEEQIRAFQQFYKYYPTFAQVIS